MSKAHENQENLYQSFVYQHALIANLKKVIISLTGDLNPPILTAAEDWAETDYKRIMDAGEYIKPENP